MDSAVPNPKHNHLKTDPIDFSGTIPVYACSALKRELISAGLWIRPINFDGTVNTLKIYYA